MPIGILSTGTYIPSHRLSGEEIAAAAGLPVEVVQQKMGIKQKTIPGPDDHTIAMGARAAWEALRKGGVDPEEIDLVIYMGEEYKEHLLMTAGIKLQAEIGAHRAWAFDIQLRCGTMMLALKLAKDLMLQNENLCTVLLAGGYRNGDLINFTNPRVRFMYNLAAGGAAVILRRGLAENRVLATKVITDGSLADCVGVHAGGTKVPLTPERLARGLYALDVFDPAYMKERLDQVSMDNFLRVIREAAEESGFPPSSIDYLAILHMKRSAHDYILSSLGLRQDQSVYLEEYGHIGQIDQVLSLELGLASGKIKNGSKIIMVSAGIGYAWTATAIRWGKDTDKHEGGTV